MNENTELIADHRPPALTRPWSAKEQVLDWLLEGLRSDDVNAGLDAYFEGIPRERVWAEVFDHLVESAEADKAAVIGWALEAYRDLYRRMVAAGELEGALKAVKELAALASRTSGVRSTQTNDGENGTGSSATGQGKRRGRRPRLGRGESAGGG